MVELEELKKIFILKRLTDPMLERIKPLVTVKRFRDRDVVFREGEEAMEFHMLYSGLILLEMPIGPVMDITLGTIKPGYSFGWSALMPPPTHYTTHAISSGNSEVFCLPGKELQTMMDEDPELGYRLLRGVVNILKKRLERRTEQFLKTLKSHPDIQKPFWE